MLDIKEAVAGSAGAICCVYSGLPFDVIKVRLQTNAQYTNIFDCMGKMCRNEGVFSLWKGAIPAVASSMIENSVLFAVNGAITRFTMHYCTKNQELTPWQQAMVGGASGFFSSTAITPAEVIKCNLQFQQGHSLYKSPIDCLLQILHHQGIKGLFRGISSLWLRDIPFSFCFFGSYEATSAALRQPLQLSPETPLPSIYILLSGGLAGAFSWSIVFPVDIVKSRLQTSYGKTTQQVLSEVYAAHGVKGFYRGWSAAVFRAFPANGFLFLGYETTLQLLY